MDAPAIERSRTAPAATPADAWPEADAALLALGEALREAGYRHVCVTPDTHALVHARGGDASSLRDVFGWSRAFARDALPPRIVGLLERAGLLEPAGAGRWRSGVRCASLEGDLLLHSAWPTTAADAVFFGPDTYRFAAFIARELRTADTGFAPREVVDLGCGSGAGGIAVARALGAQRPATLTFTDINPRALRLARINARLAGLPAERCRFVHSDVLRQLHGLVPDLVVANPPYLLDAGERAYRHGGGRLGSDLSLRIADEALARLAPGGRLLLYTAAPIVDGDDPLREQLLPLLARHGLVPGRPGCSYEEIDPDVFGAELAQPAYAAVERIAVVGLSATLPG